MTVVEMKEQLKSLIERYEGWKNKGKGDSIVHMIPIDVKALKMAIRTLEQDRWIPVEEKLPKKGEKVLATWEYITTGHRYIELTTRYGERNKYEFVGDTDEFKLNRKDHKVIAWKALPEIYKNTKGETE